MQPELLLTPDMMAINKLAAYCRANIQKRIQNRREGQLNRRRKG